MFSDQKKLEGNKSNRSLGPEYLTFFTSLTSILLCTCPDLNWGQPLMPGQQLPYAACPLCLPTSTLMQTFLYSAVITHRPNLHPCHSSRERNRGRENHLSKQHLGSTVHWVWALEKVRRVAESAVTTEELSFHRSVMLLCFSNNGVPPRQTDYPSLTWVSTKDCPLFQGQGKAAVLGWDMRCRC